MTRRRNKKVPDCKCYKCESNGDDQKAVILATLDASEVWIYTNIAGEEIQVPVTPEVLTYAQEQRPELRAHVTSRLANEDRERVRRDLEQAIQDGGPYLVQVVTVDTLIWLTGQQQARPCPS